MAIDSFNGEKSSIPPICLRRKAAAKSLGIGVRLLWQLTNRGEVPHIRVGRAVLYSVEALQAWAAANSEGGHRGQ